MQDKWKKKKKTERQTNLLRVKWRKTPTKLLVIVGFWKREKEENGTMCVTETHTLSCFLTK